MQREEGVAKTKKQKTFSSSRTRDNRFIVRSELISRVFFFLRSCSSSFDRIFWSVRNLTLCDAAVSLLTFCLFPLRLHISSSLWLCCFNAVDRKWALTTMQIEFAISRLHCVFVRSQLAFCFQQSVSSLVKRFDRKTKDNSI